jgi:hypothetical protein
MSLSKFFYIQFSVYDNVRNSFSSRFRLLWNIQAYRSGDREETCATIGIKKSYSESCIYSGYSIWVSREEEEEEEEILNQSIDPE